MTKRALLGMRRLDLPHRWTAMTAPPNLAGAGLWLGRRARTRFGAHRQNYGETTECTFFERVG
jgi:hypothetical protein